MTQHGRMLWHSGFAEGVVTCRATCIQAERLFLHCSNGVAEVHSKATELRKSWHEVQALEKLAAHCAKQMAAAEGAAHSR